MVTVIGTDEPESATPLVFRLGVWLAPFTRSHTAFPVFPDPAAPAVTLNGIVSPLEVTLKIALFGLGVPDPVVKLKVIAGGGVVKFDAADDMLNTGAGFLTVSVT